MHGGVSTLLTKVLLGKLFLIKGTRVNLRFKGLWMLLMAIPIVNPKNKTWKDALGMVDVWIQRLLSDI